ncbi:hypothetical protein ASG01_15130 [Chryseobacterium sp. Leaf180]|nr:hypothetical protein ASG01_15130 [Chryseobacterium sp. Leaf180]
MRDSDNTVTGSLKYAKYVTGPSGSRNVSRKSNVIAEPQTITNFIIAITSYNLIFSFIPYSSFT